MNILALDSSGKSASVCIQQDGVTVYEKELNEGLTHSQTLLLLVQGALQSTGLGMGDFQLLGITNGPGSFTGLRIGLALIKGLALPHNIPVAPVSTLHALAMASGANGMVVSSMDARRGEVYWSLFDCDACGCNRLLPDDAGLAQDALNSVLAQNGKKRPILLVGDGSEICYNACTSSMVSDVSVVAPAFSTAQGAANLALAMWQLGKALPPEEVQPVYLRLSQAERERLRKLAAAH